MFYDCSSATEQRTDLPFFLLSFFIEYIKILFWINYTRNHLKIMLHVFYKLEHVAQTTTATKMTIILRFILGILLMF